VTFTPTNTGLYMTATATVNVLVRYKFVGFLSPLSAAGTSSGTFNLGKAIPIKWQLTNASGGYISNLDLTKLKVRTAFSATPANGNCPVPSTAPSSTGSGQLILYPFQQGHTGSSTFRYDTSTNQYIYNWDTTFNNGAGCYVLVVDLGDGGGPYMTALRLK